MEKVVKGATKQKLAAPKSKYVEPILSAANGGESGVGEVFRTLELRLRDSTWTIVFKALIVVHLMFREGKTESTLKFISESPKRLAIGTFTDVQTQGANIRRYSEYLNERIRGYRETKTDYCKNGDSKMKKLTVERGLLRHTESVQAQIQALLQCELLGINEPENEISILAFRLVTLDLLELYKTMNEGTITALEQFFILSKPDAERALEVYRTFVKLTEEVVQHLKLARKYEAPLRIEVPQLKHAPITLTNALSDYVTDNDFEINRRQYLAQQEIKRKGGATDAGASALSRLNQAFPEIPSSSAQSMQSASPQPAQGAKGPPTDLLDFFESLGQHQQTMGQPAQQGYGYGAQVPSQQASLNPFFNQSFQQPPQFQMQPQMQMQQGFPGQGFGGYPVQPQQPQYGQNFQYGQGMAQDGMTDFGMQNQQQQQFQPQQPQQQSFSPQQPSSNPFRQSMMTGLSSPAQQSPQSTGAQRQSTNPFARNRPQNFDNNVSQPIYEEGGQMQSDDFANNSALFNASSPTAGGIQPQKTGTNPFAKAKSPPPTESGAAQSLKPSVTGTTNPFRHSAFVNAETGHGWQHSSQGALGGWDMNSVETISVFPRPGQQTAQEQAQLRQQQQQQQQQGSFL